MTTKAWSIIDQLAKDNLEISRKKVLDANEALNKISAQKIQLYEMLNDYQSRLIKAQEISHSIDDNVSYRHFIKQVQDLIQVIENEEKIAEQRLQTEEDKLIEALKEKKKSEFLIKRENDIVKRKNNSIEQKSLDEIGITRFNHQ